MGNFEREKRDGEGIGKVVREERMTERVDVWKERLQEQPKEVGLR